MCLANKDTVLASNDEAIFSVSTTHPFNIRRVFLLSSTYCSMAYLEEGIVAMTVDQKKLCFAHVDKLSVTTSVVPVPKVYRGVTGGLENTIIVSPAATPGTLDIIARDGSILRTVSYGGSVIPSHLCRVKGYVFTQSSDNRNVLKVGLETGQVSIVSTGGSWVSVDYKERLFIGDNYAEVQVVDLNGKERKLDIHNSGGFVVTSEGYAFTGSPSPGHGFEVRVFDLNKN